MPVSRTAKHSGTEAALDSSTLTLTEISPCSVNLTAFPTQVEITTTNPYRVANEPMRRVPHSDGDDNLKPFLCAVTACVRAASKTRLDKTGDRLQRSFWLQSWKIKNVIDDSQQCLERGLTVRR